MDRSDPELAKGEDRQEPASGDPESSVWESCISDAGDPRKGSHGCAGNEGHAQRRACHGSPCATHLISAIPLISPLTRRGASGRRKSRAIRIRGLRSAGLRSTRLRRSGVCGSWRIPRRRVSWCSAIGSSRPGRGGSIRVCRSRGGSIRCCGTGSRTAWIGSLRRPIRRRGARSRRIPRRGLRICAAGGWSSSASRRCCRTSGRSRGTGCGTLSARSRASCRRASTGRRALREDPASTA